MQLGAADEGHVWFKYAAVLLLCGDRPGYANACTQMVQRYGATPNLRAYLVARACTLAPDTVAEASRAGRLADSELKENAREFWSLTEQGALQYRAGRFSQAVALFEQSLRADPTPGKAVLNWLWLALAQQRLGKPDEARRWLDKATAWLDLYRDGMPRRRARTAPAQLARSTRLAPRSGGDDSVAREARSRGSGRIRVEPRDDAVAGGGGLTWSSSRYPNLLQGGILKFTIVLRPRV